MEITVLGSGSSGNATLLRGGGIRLLIDAGLSCRQLEGRLRAKGLAPEEIDGILLTHEHTDHARGARMFCNKWRAPIYCNSLTARALEPDFPGDSLRIFETGAPFAVGRLSIRSFPVPHDAMDPVGFRIEEGSCAFGFLTDLGHVSRAILEALRGVQALLIEANYEETLLERDTKRPWAVKQRIASRHGHLSNADAARALAQMDAPELEALILCHLSRDCNSPDLALSAASAVPGRRAVLCATQTTPTPTVSVG